MARSHEVPREPTRPHEITRDHTRSHETARDHTRSDEITRDRTRSHEITRDQTRSHEIARDRTRVLSQETKSLPAAHFFILFVFSLQLLVSFLIPLAAAPATEDDVVLRGASAFPCSWLVMNRG